MLGSLIALLISILLVGLTASTGARFRPDSWYRELSKPSWTPPDIAFPIAWGILYLLMALAAWRLYMADASTWRTASFVLFFLITIAIALFSQVSTLAAWLMVPYWLWVALALSLNATIWRLNRR